MPELDKEITGTRSPKIKENFRTTCAKRKRGNKKACLTGGSKASPQKFFHISKLKVRGCVTGVYRSRVQNPRKVDRRKGEVKRRKKTYCGPSALTAGVTTLN